MTLIQTVQLIWLFMSLISDIRKLAHEMKPSWICIFVFRVLCFFKIQVKLIQIMQAEYILSIVYGLVYTAFLLYQFESITYFVLFKLLLILLKIGASVYGLSICTHFNTNISSYKRYFFLERLNLNNNS